MTLTTEPRDLAYFEGEHKANGGAIVGTIVAAITSGNRAMLLDRHDWGAFIAAVQAATEEMVSK